MPEWGSSSHREPTGSWRAGLLLLEGRALLCYYVEGTWL